MPVAGTPELVIGFLAVVSAVLAVFSIQYQSVRAVLIGVIIWAFYAYWRYRITRIRIALARIALPYITDPHTRYDADMGREIMLEIAGHDWSLSPTYWFACNTPDFDNESLRGPGFAEIKKYSIRDPLWHNLKVLCEECEALEQEYERAARAVGLKDEDLLKTWKAWKHYDDNWRLSPNRTPSYPLDRDPGEPSYGPQDVQKFCKLFEEFIPDIYKRLNFRT